MTGSTPPAEVEISVGLAQRLLREQHPDLSHLELREHASGWDNAIFRLGEELAVRIPRRQIAATLVEHEAAWLPVIAPHLPLDVPVPVRVGRPSSGYPWTWTIVPWVDGEPVATSAFTDAHQVARQLGRFLAALHRPAPADAPENPFRGGPLAGRAEAMRIRMNEVIGAGVLDIDADEVDAIRSAWEMALAAPVWDRPALWLHGDLHPLNVLRRGDRIVAVIDWGDITAGDPACDLMIAWSMFDEATRATFREAADSAIRPIDDAMWERGRGWAISHALALLAFGSDAPELTAIGRRALSEAVR
jgi:aminoglycoside phosphotransferase (APT) family kinase protein